LSERRCEICGRPIRGRARVVRVEGSELRVCEECARFGREVARPSVGSGRRERGGRRPPRRAPRPRRRRPRGFDPFREGYELVPDYADRVREARERKGWSQEELAERVGEKVSVIRRIEAGKMEPDVNLARRLEKVLEVDLLEPLEATEAETSGSGSEGLTLGDVVEIRKK